MFQVFVWRNNEEVMSYGLLLLRVAVGGIMAAHGAQKVFGWWGGPGMAGTVGMCTNLGYRWPFLMGVALAASELGGGVALAAGLLTPLAALAVTVVMLTAVYLVHWPRGFFNTGGGYEFNLLIAAAAIAIVATGPGRYSLDRALGWENDITGAWWAVGVAVAAVVVALLVLTVGRRRPVVPEAKPA
jgi:putative oxidoreductase